MKEPDTQLPPGLASIHRADGLERGVVSMEMPL